MNKLKILVFACMLPMSREAEAQLGPPPAGGQLPRAQPVPLSGQSQNGTVVSSETAQTVYQQAVDRNKNGLNARIDVTRSLVELQTEQQRLTSLTNDFEKQKIALARLIGLPMAQAFTPADAIPYREAPAPNLDSLIQRAFSGRADVRAAEARVKAAELAKIAASAERYPSLDLAADYEQARDRFRAGVADTVELVQAQESVATAEQDYITALFAYNPAQVSLARAVGQTEQGIASLVGRR